MSRSTISILERNVREEHEQVHSLQLRLKQVTTERNQLKKALMALYAACPSSLDCNDFHHPRAFQHGDTEPCSRVDQYNKALALAEKAINISGGVQ